MSIHQAVQNYSHVLTEAIRRIVYLSVQYDLMGIIHFCFFFFFSNQAAVCLKLIFSCKRNWQQTQLQIICLQLQFYTEHLNIDMVHDSHYTSLERMRSKCKDPSQKELNARGYFILPPCLPHFCWGSVVSPIRLMVKLDKKLSSLQFRYITFLAQTLFMVWRVFSGYVDQTYSSSSCSPRPRKV